MAFTISFGASTDTQLVVLFDNGTNGAASVDYGATSGYGHTATAILVSGTQYTATLSVTGLSTVHFECIVGAANSGGQSYLVSVPAVTPGAQPDRETVYAALKTLLDGLGNGGPFVTVSRRIVQIEDFSKDNAPAIFQTQLTEPNTALKGIPTVRKFDVALTIFSYTGNEIDKIISTPLNALVTAVENILGPDAATAFQQLNVPVSSVQIQGPIQYFEGVLGTWGVAVIPVEIIANY